MELHVAGCERRKSAGRGKTSMYFFDRMYIHPPLRNAACTRSIVDRKGEE